VPRGGCSPARLRLEPCTSGATARDPTFFRLQSACRLVSPAATRRSAVGAPASTGVASSGA